VEVAAGVGVGVGIGAWAAFVETPGLAPPNLLNTAVVVPTFAETGLLPSQEGPAVGAFAGEGFTGLNIAETGLAGVEVVEGNVFCFGAAGVEVWAATGGATVVVGLAEVWATAVLTGEAGIDALAGDPEVFSFGFLAAFEYEE